MYIPQRYQLADAIGNTRSVWVVRDCEEYVATIHGGRVAVMADGTNRQPIVALGTGATPAAIDNYNTREKVTP